MNASLTIVASTPTTVTVASTCPFCGKVRNIVLPIEGVLLWRKGALIQQAFPNLSADDREAIISGVCPQCWEGTFGGEK